MSAEQVGGDGSSGDFRHMRAVPEDPSSWAAMRTEVRDSWQRSADHHLDPSSLVGAVELDSDELEQRRTQHPFVIVRPVVESLLVSHAQDTDLLVALSDADGTLLWVDGQGAARRQAERCMFVEGANWSESRMGTSAPGLALTTGEAAQVRQHEHFSSAVRGFSCTAVPINDPATGELLGVLDITGGQAAVGVHAQALLRAVAAAAQSQLPAVCRQGEDRVRLRVMGHGPAELVTASGRVVSLSPRHAEILLLLAHRERERPGGGMRSAELAELLWGSGDSQVTLRAEVVRLRRSLVGTGLDILSRPYRLASPLSCDALDLLDALEGCDRKRALRLGEQPLLPQSEVPAVRSIEDSSRELLREMVLSDGTEEELMSYLQSTAGHSDRWAHEVALRSLPAESPERAKVVIALERWT